MITYTKPHLTGENNGRWKGGRVMQQGYYYILKPSHPFSDKHGYVAEHRLVIEEKLGRYLKSNEIVHHKNHTRADNRVENLELMIQSEHIKIHVKKMMENRKRDAKGRWMPK